MDGLTPAIQQVDLSELEEDADYADIKKKLLDDFTETSVKPPRGASSSESVDSSLISSEKQAVLVYLRMRPRSHQETLNRDKACLHAVSLKELLAVPPKGSRTYNKFTKNDASRESNQKFLFTKIFDTNAGQKELFEQTLLPTLTDFFNGQNCLVFTYGVTNSGKTYTVTGTPSEPGLLPRTLDAIFSSLSPQQLSDLDIKPKHYSNVMYLTKADVERERQLKESMLKMANEQASGVPVVATPLKCEEEEESDTDVSKASSSSTSYSYNQSLASKCSEDGWSFELPEDSSLELLDSEGYRFSIWISFAEIYNEYIYDLLVEPAPIHSRNHSSLKLTADKPGNMFIKGLTEVRVGNVEEALLLLRLGLKHRHVAATRLNYQSSRSHSIYTIKLIRIADTSKPTSAIVNRISLVDLAGAERTGKTGATGVRVKEAGNINNSLLTLGKCVEAMKYNQNKKPGEEKFVPYRESKLTSLFHTYFVGKGRGVRLGKVTMFVNVCSNASVFDETIRVLKFSALTSKVCPIIKPPLPPAVSGHAHSRHALPFASTTTCPPPAAAAADAAPQDMPTQQVGGADQDGDDAVDDVPTPLPPLPPPPAAVGQCARCEGFEQQLREVESRRIEQEYLIRNEVSREFHEQLSKIEEEHSQELEEQAVELEEMYSKRMTLLEHSVKKQATRKRKRIHDADEEPSDQSVMVDNANLRERVSELTEELALEKNRVIAELSDASESYAAKMVQLNQQLAELGLKVFSTEKELTQYAKKQRGWEEERAAMAGERRRLEGEVEALTVRLGAEEVGKGEAVTDRGGEGAEDSALEMEILQNRISELITEKNVINSSYGELHTDFDQMKSDLQAANDQLQATLVERTAEAEAVKMNYQELRVKLATADIGLDAVKDELEATSKHLQGKLSEAITEKQSLEWSMQELQTRFTAVKASLEASSVELQAQLLEMKPEHEKLTQSCKQLTSENERLARSCEKLKQELSVAQSTSSEAIEAQLELVTAEKSKLVQSCDKLEQRLASAQQELASSEEQWAGKVEAGKTELAASKSSLSASAQEWAGQLEAGKMELASVSAKLAVNKENTYRLEAEKEEREREIRQLKKLMEKRDAELAELISHSQTQEENNVIKSDLQQAMKQTLKEYESTLDNQSTKIQSLESEGEILHNHNEELQLKCAELTAKTQSLENARSSLKSRADQLSQELQGSRGALAQREAELQEAEERSRSVLEAQVAALTQRVSSLEQELSTAREEQRSAAQHLASKEGELVALARSVGGERAEIASLSAQLTEAREKADRLHFDHCQHTETLQGRHSIEVAELRIKLRKMENHAVHSHHHELEAAQREHSQQVASLSSKLEQAEKKLDKLKAVESNNKALKKSATQLRKEVTIALKEKVHIEQELSQKISLLEGQRGAWQLETEGLQQALASLHQTSTIVGSSGSSSSLASQGEHIYEEPPELPEEPTIYETVEEEVEEEAASVEPLPAAILKPIHNTGRRSYMAAMEAGEPPHSELDRSKPFIPLLERSSMLVEESFATGGDKVEIDATPLPVRKKKAKRKRSIESVAAGENSSPGPSKKSKLYPLRSRKTAATATAIEEAETDSIKEFTPQSQWRFRAPKLFPGYRTGKKAKTAPKTSGPTPIKEDVGGASSLDTSTIASRTRSVRKKRLRKSQITGPVELMTSPAAAGKTGQQKRLEMRMNPPRPINN